MIKEKYVSPLSAIVVFGFTFIMYLLTLAPTIQEIDSGELTTAQLTLSIAHPTGYPLFTMLGYAFSKLPLPFSPAYKMNLLAALWCALAVAVFSMILRMVFLNLNIFTSVSKNKSKKVSEKKIARKEKTTTVIEGNPKEETSFSKATVILSSIFGTLMLGLSKTFWMQSTSVEVYSLHLFLIVCVIGAGLRAYIYTVQNPEQSRKVWILFSIVLALSFSNHMSTLMILPGAAFLYFVNYKSPHISLKNIGIYLLTFFVILITVYSYLPIRAAQNPLLNWSNPSSVETFIRHVSGWQYRVWMFSGIEKAKDHLGVFAVNFLDEYNISTLFVLVGMFYLGIKKRKLFLFVFITFIFTIFYSINYDIKDLDSYFLLAYVSMGFFAAFGLAYIITLLYDKKYHYGLGLIIAVVFTGVQIYFTADKVDKHNSYIYEDFSKAALNSLEKDAVIITFEWDFLVAPSYYTQNILKVRNDVTIVDKELLRRSWYYNQMKTNHAAVVAPVQPAIDGFLNAVQPFERGEVHYPNVIEANYRAVINDFIVKNFDSHPIYLGPDIVEIDLKKQNIILPDGYSVIPDLFFYRVVRNNEYKTSKTPDYKIRFPKEQDDYTENIYNITTTMLIQRSLYELSTSNIERAKIYTKKMKEEFPEKLLPPELTKLLVN